MILLSIDALICLFLLKKNNVNSIGSSIGRHRRRRINILNRYPFSFRIRGGADSIINITTTNKSELTDDDNDDDQLLQEDDKDNIINTMEDDYILSSTVTATESEDEDDIDDDKLIEDDSVIMQAVNVKDTNVTASSSSDNINIISDNLSHNDTITDDRHSTYVDENNVNNSTTIIDSGSVAQTNATESNINDNKARDLRMEGKEHHDTGDYHLAIQKFEQAIEELTTQQEEEDQKSIINEEEILEELSTCNLHMALCQLKSHQYQDCIQTCNDVLQQEEEGNNNTTIKTINNSNSALSTAIRARAYHRRAKARYALDHDSEEALDDAKTAAFLAPGNSKTVAFYGKLMRQHMVSTMPTSPSAPSSFFPSSNPLFGSTTSPSSTSSSSPPIPNFDSILGNFLPQLPNTKNNDNSQSMVQTIFQSLNTHLRNENLQNTICSTLNKVSSTQLQSMSSLLLGFDLSSTQSSNIVNIIQKIKLTPKKIQRYLFWGEKTYKGFVVLRKVNGIWKEYKIFVVYALIALWIYKCRMDLLESFIP